ncbi:MAG: caspase family protein [Brevundimonas sp.]|uniref:caspase family protein n=1 Tax=Brevundimonas sp. TaxID=1871086 RepID=UPI0025845201|nr:caspase family protein [Brevundimonas sp.]MCV0415722.1 caspase family protein [Brevundimonas sp.]
MSGYRLPRRATPPPKRVALLIGVAGYPGEDALRTPLEDIRLVRTTLEARSFTCRSLENPGLAEIVEALETFTKENRDAEHAVLYFSGHGFEHAGQGAVLPVDFPFPPDGENLHHAAVSVSELEETFRGCAGVGVLVLDACRITLAPGDADRWTQISVRRGQPVGDQPRLLVAWSTSAGAVAWDGDGATSRYTAAFAKHASDHRLDLEAVFASIGREVDAGAKPQHPWIRSGLRSPAAWTDLPRFAQPTIVNTPLRNIDHGPLTLSRSAGGDRLLVTGRNRALWGIMARTAELRCVARLPHEALAAELMPGGVAVAEKETGLRVLREASSASCVLEPDAYGVRLSPDGRHGLAYGLSWVSILDLSGAAPVVKWHHPLPFDPYGAAFQDERTAWLVGADGAVARIDVIAGEVVEVTQRHPYVGCLYDVAVLENGDLMIVGAVGSVRRCRPGPGRPTVLTRDPRVQYGGSDPVPRTANLRLQELWVERLGDSDALFCDVSPDGLLLAVGMVDGDVHGVDLRDGASAMVWPSRLHDMSLQGVAFTDDGALAILHGDGAVTLSRPV